MLSFYQEHIGMENPFLRKATSLQSSFLENLAMEKPTLISIDYSQLRFAQLVSQIEEIKVPRGSLKRKLAWAERNFGDRVSDVDFGYVPKSKAKAWRKWKKLIKLALLDEIAQDLIDVSESSDTVTYLPGLVEQLPEIIINPAPPILVPDSVISVKPEPGPEVSVNPAPPILVPDSVISVKPEPGPEISVNPAPPIFEADFLSEPLKEDPDMITYVLGQEEIKLDNGFMEVIPKDPRDPINPEPGIIQDLMLGDFLAIDDALDSLLPAMTSQPQLIENSTAIEQADYISVIFDTVEDLVIEQISTD